MRTSLGVLLSVLIATSALVASSGCGGSSSENHGHGHAQLEAQFERGPHGGRLLRKDDFSLEVQIFETGVPPQFRVFAYSGGKQLAPRDIWAEITLTRLGDVKEVFSLTPVGEYVTSTQEVTEPHSFDVLVKARYGAKDISWEYPSPEARTIIPQEVAAQSGVGTEKAVSRMIATTDRVRGKIVPSEHRIAHVIPRFSGVVKEGRKHIGDKVERGEVMAIIESNQSLQPFEVRSQISGTVVNGHLIVGEFVPENQWVFVVADLSEVWADFFLPLRDRAKVSLGKKVKIHSPLDNAETDGVVSYVAPFADEKSQAQLIRVVVPNENNALLPGMFVTGDVVLEESNVPVAIKKEAVQRFRDWDVVFARYGDVYEARPLTLGRSDGEWVEVVKGLSAGDEYVVSNSFLIKADILKSGATHDH